MRDTGWVQRLYPDLPTNIAEAIEGRARILSGGDPAHESYYVVTAVRRFYDPNY